MRGIEAKINAYLYFSKRFLIKNNGKFQLLSNQHNCRLNLANLQKPIYFYA